MLTKKKNICIKVMSGRMYNTMLHRTNINIDLNYSAISDLNNREKNSKITFFPIWKLDLIALDLNQKFNFSPVFRKMLALAETKSAKRSTIARKKNVNYRAEKL